MFRYGCPPPPPVIVNTTLFIHAYAPARHIRIPHFHCTQGERVICSFEPFVKTGWQEKLFHLLKEDKSWQRW